LIPTLDYGVDQRTADRAVRSFVAAGSGLPGERVIPGNDDGPSPGGLYASALLTASRREGRSWVLPGPPGATHVERVVSNILAVYQIQWYREGAHEFAMRFRAWTESPAAEIHARQHGFSYLRCGEVVQVDDVISAEWEERAAVDLYICHYRILTQDVGIIETVPLRVQDDPEVRITI